VASTARCHAAGSRTSSTIVRARSADHVSSLARRARPASSTSAATTFAPRETSSIAVRRPMPLAQPVTSAAVPSIRRVIGGAR
jgi:hypothetical protein